MILLPSPFFSYCRVTSVFFHFTGSSFFPFSPLRRVRPPFLCDRVLMPQAVKAAQTLLPKNQTRDTHSLFPQATSPFFTPLFFFPLTPVVVFLFSPPPKNSQLGSVWSLGPPFSFSIRADISSGIFSFLTHESPFVAPFLFSFPGNVILAPPPQPTTVHHTRPSRLGTSTSHFVPFFWPCRTFYIGRLPPVHLDYTGLFPFSFFSLPHSNPSTHLLRITKVGKTVPPQTSAPDEPMFLPPTMPLGPALELAFFSPGNEFCDTQRFFALPLSPSQPPDFPCAILFPQAPSHQEMFFWRTPKEDPRQAGSFHLFLFPSFQSGNRHLTPQPVAVYLSVPPLFTRVLHDIAFVFLTTAPSLFSRPLPAGQMSYALWYTSLAYLNQATSPELSKRSPVTRFSYSPL